MYSARPSLSLGFAKIADGSRLACFPPLSYGLSQITDHPSILHPNILTSLTWRYWGIHTPVSTWETALWPSYSTGILKLNSRIGLGAFKHFHHLSSGEGGGGGGAQVFLDVNRWLCRSDSATHWVPPSWHLGDTGGRDESRAKSWLKSSRKWLRLASCKHRIVSESECQ